ncbi:hypothetical protein D9758_007657 [Tetrapyrgos nigripes]|uniref:Uncharacterized protein n=1 Tax=Tetrapyrgos nigripes TaxID=182062 RepID=A0A8H5G587_9AGAR|nr:hypothetical protein D9758_007657 [Tetrapyrgos nigripes]
MQFLSLSLVFLPLLVQGIPQRSPPPTTTPTVAPTTVAPTTVPPTTVAPTTVPPTTVPSPTTSATVAPTSTAAPEPEPPVFEVVFSNLTGAINAPGFLTFALVQTVDDCEAFCNGVAGCVFLNAFNDVNGKDNSTLLTCSVYDTCHNATEATNTGGQTQPDGTVDFIKDSTGECKVVSGTAPDV